MARLTTYSLLTCRLLLALEPGIIPAKYTKPAKMPFQQVKFRKQFRSCSKSVFNADGSDQRIYWWLQEVWSIRERPVCDPGPLRKNEPKHGTLMGIPDIPISNSIRNYYFLCSGDCWSSSIRKTSTEERTWYNVIVPKRSWQKCTWLHRWTTKSKWNSDWAASRQQQGCLTSWHDFWTATTNPLNSNIIFVIVTMRCTITGVYYLDNRIKIVQYQIRCITFVALFVLFQKF